MYKPKLLDTLKSGVKLYEIPDFPNSGYAAGDDGNVYSHKKLNTWKILIPSDKKGYCGIVLSTNGKPFRTTTHRIICKAFFGLPTKERYCVRHLDGTRNNNAPSNLRWGSYEENAQDRIAHGRSAVPKGVDNPRSILNKYERSHIKWALKNELCSTAHMARMLGVSFNTIKRAANDLDGVEIDD